MTSDWLYDPRKKVRGRLEKRKVENYALCYMPRLYVEIKVALSFLYHFLHMHCVDLVENALFNEPTYMH